jgi:hypothetical protein
MGMGIDIAQPPESYTLTLTLSHTWERGCGPDHYWQFSCSRSIWFCISIWIPVLTLESRNANWAAMGSPGTCSSVPIQCSSTRHLSGASCLQSIFIAMNCCNTVIFVVACKLGLNVT